MRHDLGTMGQENKLKVCDLLRCKARVSCRLNPEGRGNEVNERGAPIIRLTLLMRRGARSFKNATVVIDTFKNECARVEGCILNVAQSEDLGFCDQVSTLYPILYIERNMIKCNSNSKCNDPGVVGFLLYVS